MPTSEHKATTPVDELIVQRDRLAAADPALAGTFAAFKDQYSRYLELTKQFEAKTSEAATAVKSAGTYYLG
jgi:hypothetical protein